MEKENKVEEKEEEKEEETKEEETPEVPETPKEEEKEEEEEPQNEVDYKAELEKAQSSAQYYKEKNKELRKEVEEKKPEEVPEEDKVTKDDLKTLEANLTRSSLRSHVEMEAAKIANNEDEKKLILHYYENRMVPTGNVYDDIAECKLLANKSRIAKTNEELIAALNSKKTMGIAAGAGQKPTESHNEPQLDLEIKKTISRNGMTWNSKSKLFENNRGKTYEPVTGDMYDPPRN